MVVKASIPYETVEGESATAEERKICNPVQRALNLGRGTLQPWLDQAISGVWRALSKHPQTPQHWCSTGTPSGRGKK